MPFSTVKLRKYTPKIKHLFNHTLKFAFIFPIFTLVSVPYLVLATPGLLTRQVRKFNSIREELEQSASSDSNSSESGPKKMSELEWNSYSQHTRDIAIAVWGEKDSVPPGFLSIPEHAERFKDAERIYTLVQSKEAAVANSKDSDVVTIKEILVSKALAEKHDYVVENPHEPGTPLYLTQTEFTKLMNSCISNGQKLRVLLHPGKKAEQKFPPMTINQYRNWITPTKRTVQPFIFSDPGSWVAFVNPTIASKKQLLSATPGGAELLPKTKITRATGHLVRAWSTIQSVCGILDLRPHLSWLLVSLMLQFCSWWFHTSLDHSCSIFKEAKRLVLKYLAGTPEFKSSVVALGIDKHGLPYLIPQYIRTLVRHGNAMAISVLLLGLDIPRFFVYIGADKLSTITRASDADPRAIEDITGAFERIAPAMPVPTLEERVEKWTISDVSSTSKPLARTGLFFTNKIGPNGNAIATAIWDALALVKSPAFEHIERYATLVQGTKLLTYIKLLAEIATWLNTKLTAFSEQYVESPRFAAGKIARVFTAYGKVRLIAIPAYFVQVLFKPIHELVFSILRKIPF